MTRDKGLAILSAILLWLSFPPLGWEILVFFSFVPLISAISGKSLKQAFFLGYLTGFVFFVLLLHWITFDPVESWVKPFLYIGLILICAYLGLYFGIYALSVRFFDFRLKLLSSFLGACIFCSLEFLRGIGILGFPWGNPGYVLARRIPLIQFAEFTGVLGVTFWILLLNHLIYESYKNRLFRIIGVVILIIPVIYGIAVIPSYTTSKNQKIKIGMVQGNITQDVKWDERFIGNSFDVFANSSRRIAIEKTNLIVWPETAMPVNLRWDGGIREKIENLTLELDTPILTGAPEIEYEGGEKFKSYNSAFLFVDGKIAGDFRKIHLVPFGERMPFENIFPFLGKLNFGEGDFMPGEKRTIFQIPLNDKNVKFSSLICFESVFPHEVRLFVLDGADFLVNITNDSWFGRTGSATQHADMSVFRAIENRIAIARCANSGITMFVDPFGRIFNETKIFIRTEVKGEIPLRSKITFYTKYGDIFAFFCIGISICGFIVKILLRKRN